MPSHVTRSPHVSKAVSTRHRHSLVDTSEHDPYLVIFLLSPISHSLVQELIKTTERVIRIPSDSLTPGALITPPVTPVKATLSQQQQRGNAPVKPAPVPVHLSSKWKPLDQFVIRLIQASNVRVATLSYALIVLDRLKEKLPPLAQGKQ